MADRPVEIVANVVQERREGQVLRLRGLLDGHRVLARSDLDSRTDLLQRRHGGDVVAFRGDHAGRRAFAPTTTDDPIAFRDRPGADRRSAVLRARALLCTFLDRRQRAELRASGGLFWEHTATGWFRLGRYYDIRYRPHAAPAVEQSICVVTGDLGLVPEDDLWVNLLLMLRADPVTFRAAAFVQALDVPAEGQYLAREHLPADRRHLDRLQAKRADDWSHGRHLDAAFTDGTIARLAHDAGDDLAALWHAIRAVAVIAAQTTVYNDDERARWRAHHAPAYDFMARLVAADDRDGRAQAFAHDAFAGVRTGLLRGPAIDRAEAELISWLGDVNLLERTFAGVFR